MLRELLVPLGYCLGGFLVFWLAFEVFSDLNEYQRGQLHFFDVVLCLLYGMPRTLGYVVPMGLLLALLYALTNHARCHELTAIRAAGVSMWRLAAPYLAVAAACGGFLFLVNEIILPDGEDRVEQVKKKYTQPADANARIVRKVSFFVTVDGRRNTIGPFDFNLATGEMIKPMIYLRPAPNLTNEIMAERGVYSNGCWHFLNAEQNLYSEKSGRAPERPTSPDLEVRELRDPPARIYSELKINGMSDLKSARGMSLSLGEILSYWRWNPDRLGDVRLATKFHTRLAAPATCLVVVLIALPFGAASGRRNAFVGVASAVFICFAFFVVQRFGEAAGMGGKLTPWLAGWLPNLLFGAIGVWLTARTR